MSMGIGVSKVKSQGTQRQVNIRVLSRFLSNARCSWLIIPVSSSQNDSIVAVALGLQKVSMKWMSFSSTWIPSRCSIRFGID